MTIVRVGSTDKYASGWETAFGGKKKAKAAPATAAPKAAAKSTAKAAPKKAAKKSPAKKAKRG